MYQVAGGVDNISGIKVNLVEWRKKRKVSHSIKISPRCSAWLVSDILNLINKAAEDVLGK
jgi:hypothetical protein